jgi:hypothetical protein
MGLLVHVIAPYKIFGAKEAKEVLTAPQQIGCGRILAASR